MANENIREMKSGVSANRQMTKLSTEYENENNENIIYHGWNCGWGNVIEEREMSFPPRNEEKLTMKEWQKGKLEVNSLNI